MLSEEEEQALEDWLCDPDYEETLAPSTSEPTREKRPRSPDSEAEGTERETHPLPSMGPEDMDYEEDSPEAQEGGSLGRSVPGGHETLEEREEWAEEREADL
jgi:hypothetical protein